MMTHTETRATRRRWPLPALLVCALASVTFISAIGTPGAWAQTSALDLIEAAQAPEGQKHSLYHDYAVRSEFVRVTAPSASTESVRFAALGQDLTLSSDTATMKNGILAWEGVDDAGSVAVLIVEGTSVLGTIETAGGTYAVAAVPGDLHEVLELDPALFPPLLGPDATGDASASAVAGASSRIDRARISQIESAYLGWVDYDGDYSTPSIAATVTIKVMVATTGKADDNAEPSSSSLVRMIETKANRVYRTNDLPIRIDTVHDGITGYSEGSSVAKDLEKLVTPSDTATRRIHILAERNDADLVILLVHNSPGSTDVRDCGKAQETLAKRTATAFAVVHHACVINHHATAAIGVLQGAGFAGARNPEFSYAKAYSFSNQRTTFGTVMIPGGAYCGSNDYPSRYACTQKEIWSDPHRNFFGRLTPAGTVEAWNAKALFATGPHVASLRGAAQSYDSTAPTGAITLPSTIPSSGSMEIRAVFSEPIHGAFPPNLTVTDGTQSTTATMTKVSDTVYTYSHVLDGESGTTSLLFSNARDRFGNPVAKAPTSGATFVAAARDVTDPSPASGALTSASDSFTSRLTRSWTLSGDANWRIGEPSEMDVPGLPIRTNRVLLSEACDDSCIATFRSKLNTVEPLTIEFDRYVDRKIDTREGLFVEYSTDGSTWTELASYTGAKGHDTSRWEREVIGLSIPEGSAQIRLHAKSNGSGETVEVDNFSVYRPSQALPDVTFTARLNDARSSVSLVFSKSTSHVFAASDFTVSAGNISSVTNSPNSAARSLAISGVSYDTAVKVTYTGRTVDLGGGAMLHNGTSATAPPIPRPDRAPSISAIQDVTLAQGASATRQVTASDPDGDAIRLSISGNPIFVSLSDRGSGRGTVTVSPAASSAAGKYTMAVTATAGSLSASTSFAVTVTVPPDSTPPRITPPPDVTAEATGTRTAVSVGTAVATDARDGTVAATSNAPATFPLGATTVTWTARDAAGNTATATQTVTVRDTTAPAITAPPDVTAEAAGSTTSVQTGAATATDAVDSSVTVTSNAPSSFPLGTTTITWTATDSSGNSASAKQAVTVRDTTAPAVTAPPDITAELTGVPMSVQIGTATATDAVDSSVTVTSNAPSSFPLGTTTITWTATDSSGNSASAKQAVTVRDTTPPTIMVSTPSRVEANTSMTRTDSFARMHPSDLSGIRESSVRPELAPIGTTVIHYSATDTSGNGATVSRPVTLVAPQHDTLAPAFPAPPDIAVRQFSSTATVSYSTMTVWDDYDPSPAVTCNPPSGSAFQEGTTKVDCSVSDASGNVRLRHFYVLVEASGATRASVHENGFDGGLGNALLKETTWNENGRVCGAMASSTSSATSVYSLSHSQEAGGSAHLKYSDECWSGHSGIASAFSVAPGSATSTLVASFDYRGLADLKQYTHINHVNNMHFTISDSQGRLLDLGKPLTGKEPGILNDTGWRSVTAVVPQVGPALCPCELYAYTGDFWSYTWKKQLYVDNVSVELVPAAPPGPSGASAASGQLGQAAPEPPNLLTVGELLAMQAHADSKAVIVEKRAHEDSVLVSWDHDDWGREYKVVIRPASDPSDKFADTVSGGEDSYRFVNLSPGTEYVVSVGERGNDYTQASVNVRTAEAGTQPFDPGLYLSARQDGGSVQIRWTDHNGGGADRYRVERSVDGGPFAEIENQPGAGTETTDSVNPEWYGKQVTYKAFEWFGKQKLYSDEVSFIPQPG